MMQRRLKPQPAAVFWAGLALGLILGTPLITLAVLLT